MSDLARYRTKAEWEKINPILRSGEPGFEDDTGKLKIGDGTKRWKDLPYQDVAPYTLPKPVPTPAGVSTSAVAQSIADAHDTDAEREGFVPARLSVSSLATTDAATHDTDVERESFVPARLSDLALRAYFTPLINIARLKGSQMIRNMAVSPASAPPLMTTPPTVTQDTSTALGSSFTSAHLRFSGPLNASPTVGGSMQVRGSTNAVGVFAVNPRAMQMAFDCDGQYVDIQLRANAGLRYRVWVNEQAATSDLVAIPSATGANAYLHLDFGSTTRGIPRRIVVEFEDLTNPPTVIAVRCGVLDYFAPPATPSPRVIWVGDSFGRGEGGVTRQSFSFARQVGRMLGWADCWNVHSSVAGSGLVKPADATFGNYGTRLDADIVPYNPDLVVVQGSVNDTGASYASQVGSALTTYLTRLRAALPNTVVVVTSPLIMGDTLQSQRDVATAMKSAADAFGVPFVNALTPAVFRGTGAVGSPQAGGGGMADWSRTTDFTHPTDLGAYALARYMSGLIGQALGLSV